MNKLISSTKPLVWFTALLLTAVMAGCGGQDPILGGAGGGVSNLPQINTSMLGSAATFGIASTAGITDTNTAPLTTINGDVVLANPTPTCNASAVPGGPGSAGFGVCGSTTPTSVPALNLSYNVITPIFPDTTTAATVKADMNTGYLAITPPAGPPAAGSLGGGVVIGAPSAGIGGLVGAPCVYNINAGNCFTPGVYTAASTITITGDLTLDAQGNSNAVFVFQAGSTVDTAAGAAPPGTRTRILLINGAKASNVWWQVGSSATLGVYSEFQGNILAAASITMGTGSTSCGRLFAGAWSGGGGAFAFDSNVVSVPGQPFAPPAGYSTTCQ